MATPLRAVTNEPALFTGFRLASGVRRLVVCALTLGAMALCDIGRAQQAPGMAGRAGPPAAGTALIIGQVTEAGTARAVAGAIVTMSGAPAGVVSVETGGVVPIDQLPSMDVSSMTLGVRQRMTDAQGRFAFTGIPKGIYSLQAVKPGWTGGGYAQLRPDSPPLPFALADGDALDHVGIRLWRYSTISGTILDAAGDPIIGVGIRALRRTWLAGTLRLAPAALAQSDDRGMYRLSSLVPGDYVVAIPQTIVTSPAADSGSAGNDSLGILSTAASGFIRVGEWVMQASGLAGRSLPPIQHGQERMLAYQTTFFPIATTASQGSTVTVESGDDRAGIDFQLKPTAVMSVSGTVTGPEGPMSSVGVRLVPGGTEDFSSDAGFETAMCTTSAAGAFMLLAVPPGQYTIRVLKIPLVASPAMPRPVPSLLQNGSGGMATSMGAMTVDMIMPAPSIPTAPTLWAAVPVSVGDNDVAGLSVPLRSGIRVSGRLAFDGAGTPPAVTQFRRVPILLDRADTGGISPNPGLSAPGDPRRDGGRFDESGQFSTYGVVPGKYFVRVPFSVSGWSLRSAKLGAQDLADVPLAIETRDVVGVVLTFTDRISQLTGVVRGDQGNPDAEASVVVFPAESIAWTEFGSAPRRIRTARTGTDGRYTITGLPAGDYLAIAVHGDVGMDWQNPQFLGNGSRAAAKLTIGEAERKIQDLRTAR